MAYTILIDGKPVATAATEVEARAKAEVVQREAVKHVHDEFGGAFAVVGFAPSDNLSAVSYLPPRDSVPDVLLPSEFRQFR